MKTKTTLALLFLSFYYLFGQDSLRLHLNFNNELKDLTPFKHSVTESTSLKYSSALCGHSVIIGNNDVEAISVDSKVLDQLKDFTFTAIVKIDGYNSNNNLLSCANSNQANELIIGYNSAADQYNDGWHFRINNIFYYFDENDIMDDEKWHRVTLVRKSSTGFLYIDGELIGSPITVDDRKLHIRDNGLIIGQDQDCLGGCFDHDQSWFGEIDDLKIFSKALTQNEVERLGCAETVIGTTNKLKIFPTLFKDEINLNKTNMEFEEYHIYSMSGKLIEEGNINQQKILVNSGLPKGMYFLSLIEKESKKRTIVKILKQ